MISYNTFIFSKTVNHVALFWDYNHWHHFLVGLSYFVVMFFLSFLICTVKYFNTGPHRKPPYMVMWTFLVKDYFNNNNIISYLLFCGGLSASCLSFLCQLSNSQIELVFLLITDIISYLFQRSLGLLAPPRIRYFTGKKYIYTYPLYVINQYVCII